MKTAIFQRSLSISLGLLCAFSAFSDESYNVALTLTPNPTTLNSSGGTVKYDRTIRNLTSTPMTLTYHGLLLRPDGSQLPMTTELSMPLTAFEIKTQTALGYAIPNYFPAGNYTYRLYFHDIPERHDTYEFTFKKTGTNPAPTPRSVVSQSVSLNTLPEAGGSVIVKSGIRNISNSTESLRYWTVLTKPDGDTQIFRDPANISLPPAGNFTITDRTLTLSASAPHGVYSIATYAMSNSRNTPALVAKNNIEKSGTPIASVQFYDPALQQCFEQQAATNRWRFVQDVVSLSCIDYGIKDLIGLQALGDLQKLDLSDNDIQLLDEWQLPPMLKSLNLSHNRIREVMPMLGLKSLEELHLAGNRLTKLQGLEYLSQLKTLDLSHNPLRGDSLENLLRNTFNLRKIYLAGITFENARVTDWLAGHFQLEELDLSDTGLVIRNLNVSPGLRVLRLANTHIQDSYVLNRFHYLNVLDIANTNITDLNSLGFLTELRELNVSGNAIRDTYTLSEWIRNNPELQKLNVADIDLPSRWLNSLYAWPNVNTKLRELNIRNTNQESAVLPFINLNVLDISENPVHGELSLPQPKQLKSLRMGYTQLSHIAQIEQLTQLEVLDMSGNNGFDSNIIASLIAQNGNLHELYLNDKTSSTLLSWGAIDHIASKLNILQLKRSNLPLHLPYLPNLKTLDLSSFKSFLGDMPPLGPMPRLRSLHIDQFQQPSWFIEQFNDLDALSIANTTSLTSSYIESIGQRHPNLRYLSLAGNNLRTSSLSQILGSARETLTTLDLGDCLLSQYSFDSLGFMPVLRELNFAHNRLDMFHFQQFPYLQKLDLSYTGMHYLNTYRPTADIAMRDLNISGNPLQNFTLEELLSNMTTLNHLSINDMDMSTLDFAHLNHLMQHIKSLDMANTQTVLSGFYLPALDSIDISGNTIQGHVFAPWVRTLKMNNVSNIGMINLPRDAFGFKVLEVANTLVDPAVIETALSNSPLLRELNIAGQYMPNTRLNDLLRQMQRDDEWSALQSLNISDTAIQTDGFIPLKNLRSLSLSGLGLLHIPAIEFLPSQLDVSNNPIEDLRLPTPQHITSLNLSGIDAGQLRDLPNMLQQANHLVELKLANTGLSDTQLITTDRLLSLDLRGNNLSTSDGLARLLHLRTVDLSGNQLVNIDELGPMQPDLRTVNLSQNDLLACSEVERLHMTYPDLELVSPDHCVVH